MTKIYLKTILKNSIVEQTSIKNFFADPQHFLNFLFCIQKSKKVNNEQKKLKIDYSKNYYLLKKYKIIAKKRKKTFVLPVFLSKTKKKSLLLFSFIKKLKKLKKLKTVKNLNKNKIKNFVTKPNKVAKYGYFISDIFKKIFKNKVTIINFNYFLKTKVKKFIAISRRLHNKSKFFKKTIFIQKILKITLASLLYKDSKILIHVIKEIFEKTHYSKHKMYFIFWKNFIKGFLIKFYKRLAILGLKLEFHGKLGVGGNSKKRSYYYSVGRCSNSTKLFKIDSTNSFFRTQTGVVGFTYSIYY